MNCTKTNKILLSLVIPLVLNWIASSAVHCETIVHENDRIVFCGDSITGQGGKGGPAGWVGLVQEGLEDAHPGGHQILTALGASGSPVGGWVNAERKSRDDHFCMDVPNVDVKTTLDGGAEVLIIMLGMNDLLGPAIKPTPADYDGWALRFRGLVDALKGRVHPRVVGLATITPCTEDLGSPKNRAEAELNSRLVALAKDENALVLPTHEAMTELLATGRSYQPDFHITRDFVHPNPAGHLAIAVGMLRGLGENLAADRLLDKYSILYRVNADGMEEAAYDERFESGEARNETTGKFPKWEITPESPWNFALALDTVRFAEQIRIERRPLSGNAWTQSSAPIRLHLPARRVRDWDLDRPKEVESECVQETEKGWVPAIKIEQGDFAFTPQLPDPAELPGRLEPGVETVTLVPYGCTRLRLSIFPFAENKI